MYSNMMLGDVFVVCHSMDDPGSLLTVEKFLERGDNNVDDIYAVVFITKWGMSALVPHSSQNELLRNGEALAGKRNVPHNTTRNQARRREPRFPESHPPRRMSGDCFREGGGHLCIKRREQEGRGRLCGGHTNAKFNKFTELKDAVAFVGCCQGVKCCEGCCPEDCPLKTGTKRTIQEKGHPQGKEAEEFCSFWTHRAHTVQLFLRPSFQPCEGHQGAYKLFKSQ